MLFSAKVFSYTYNIWYDLENVDFDVFYYEIISVWSNEPLRLLIQQLYKFVELLGTLRPLFNMRLFNKEIIINKSWIN